jgi:hypothetical protein
MLTEDKIKTLNQVSMIKIKTKCMVVILDQLVIKIKLKMMVKMRIKMVVMTKWLLKSLLLKLTLVVKR